MIKQKHNSTTFGIVALKCSFFKDAYVYGLGAIECKKQMEDVMLKYMTYLYRLEFCDEDYIVIENIAK